MGDLGRRWLFDGAHPALGEIDRDIAENYLADENEAVRRLVARA